VKVLETRYAGCKFRSRLEARWAVFFDRMRIPWDYEPEAFETSAGNYLPDFQIDIPQHENHGGHRQWFEVKPPGAPRDERHAAFGDEIGKLIVARGLPRNYSEQMRGWASALTIYGVEAKPWPCAFADGTDPNGSLHCSLGDNRHWCQDSMDYFDVHLALYGWHPPEVADPVDYDGEADRWPDEIVDGFMTYPPLRGVRVDRAYEAARSARFGT
jgi:hypothetical protein